jgi:hypothetical protein
MSPQKGSKASTEDPTTTEQNSASNGRVPCQEHDHPDEELIYASNFPFDEVFPLMKKNKCIGKLKNVLTGALFSDIHHMKNEGPKTLKDFYNFGACFCAEWVKVIIDGRPYWVRCGNMFNRKFLGCTDHPKAMFEDAPNRIYTEMAADRPGNWGMLKNEHLEEEAAAVEPTHEDLFAKQKDEFDELGEQTAAMNMRGQGTKELEAEQRERLKQMSRLHKNVIPATPQHSGPTKALPATNTDGLRTRGGRVGGRGKVPKSTAGDRLLDIKAKQTPNTRGGRIKKGKLPLEGVPEEEPANHRKKPRRKDQNQGGDGSVES